MATKHEKILEYIKSLPVGSKISVRKIAKQLGVSEGTSYRAIKEAELEGYVTSIERIGTVRIEKHQKAEIEKLTFAEVVKIVDGTVLGGKDGLHKELQRFVIGAMELEDLKQYLGHGRLIIVGNRDQVHRSALNAGTAVLITGGFDTSEEVKRLSDQLQLPIISSRYDTFTVATMINRAIFDRLIKKEILLVEDILGKKEPIVLRADQLVADYEELVRNCKHTRYPVVDSHRRVIGMLTSKDVIGVASTEKVAKHMNRNPIIVMKKTPIAVVAHEMISQGIELIPVIDDQNKLIGVVSRKDVIEAQQSMHRHLQMAGTIHELSVEGLRKQLDKHGAPILVGKVTPQMTDHRGVLSTGVLTSLLTESVYHALREKGREDLAVQSLMLNPLKPIQIDREIQVYCSILELGRTMSKMDLEVKSEGQLVAKAFISAQVMEK